MNGAVIFSVDGSLDCAEPVPLGYEAAFTAALRTEDCSLCVWTDERDSHLLRAAIEVAAHDFNGAIDAALRELRSAARASSASAGRPSWLR